MTIDEAIKIKEKDLAENYYEPGSKLEQANKLGIEALEYIREHPETWKFWNPVVLPREAKE